HSDISLVSNKADTGNAGTGDTADHAATGAGTGATLGTILGGCPTSAPVGQNEGLHERRMAGSS
ncbi:hypothetical protein MKK67_03875, partial [Methylobacterium sp. J-072]|nr:hypothetical protein [Methylobacterium sp. J-072]